MKHVLKAWIVHDGVKLREWSFTVWDDKKLTITTHKGIEVLK